MNEPSFSVPFRVSVFVCLAALAACSGSGTNSGTSSSSLPPFNSANQAISSANATPASPAPAAEDVAASSSAASTNADNGYVTIQGTVLSNDAPYTRVVIRLASGDQVAVYTSELKAAKVGDIVSATGYYNSKGNFQAASAHIVSSASPTPRPSTTPSARPSTTPSPRPSASPSPLPLASPPPGGSNTLGRVGLSQIFDFNISAAQKTGSGPRYNVVWGAGDPRSWRAHNSSLIAARYFIIMQSDSTHPLSYFTTYHPDWILYNCTSSGSPTRTPAYMQAGAYGTNAPLDIQNPAVISFQLNTLAIPPMLASGYNGLAADQVVFSNIMGGNAGTGSYGCGVYQGSTFVRRYKSKGDARWASDVVNWVKTAKSILTPKNLKLVINHPAGSTASTLEQTVLANTDVALSEVGFSNYGSYTRSSTFFATALNYMTYTQAHGVTAMLIDKFVQSAALSSIQREWAVGTYLMGNNGNALLYATYGGYGTGGYGKEYYYPEYATNMGAPCGAVTGGPQIYQRKFANGLVVVNADIATHSASLPPLHIYHDIEGRPVTNPLVVPPTNAFVMTTLAGTGCL